MRVLARALGVVGSFVADARPAARGISVISLSLASGSCAILAPAPKPAAPHVARTAPAESGAHPPSSTEGAAAKNEPPPAPRDDGRLPDTAVPQGYVLRLTVDPHKPRFSGVTTIAVEVPAPM